jgi:thiamine pyrophosphate-dependent acetolactate synthase large subunit-like protein
MKTTDIRISGAAALLQALSDHKIDHVFSNAGTASVESFTETRRIKIDRGQRHYPPPFLE